MKMRWMAVAVLAFVALACGGTVEEESTGTQAQQEVSALSGTGSEESLAGSCGGNTCGKGTFCCNSSCGICAPIGGGCPDVVCESQEKPAVEQAPEESLAGSCGGNVCGKGTFCCNPSCGICAPIGGGCPDVVC